MHLLPKFVSCSRSKIRRYKALSKWLEVSATGENRRLKLYSLQHVTKELFDEWILQPSNKRILQSVKRKIHNEYFKRSEFCYAWRPSFATSNKRILQLVRFATISGQWFKSYALENETLLFDKIITVLIILYFLWFKNFRLKIQKYNPLNIFHPYISWNISVWHFRPKNWHYFVY